MCAALVGGMDRLKRDYINTAKDRGVSLKVFTGQESNIGDRLGGVDLVIVFTNKVSHEARKKAVKFAKTQNIPIQLVHACGISTLSCYLKDASDNSNIQPASHTQPVRKT